MSPLELLLAEQWPDGSFGGIRPPAARYRPCIHPDDQARHRADLEAALDGSEWHQPIPNPLRRPTRKASR
ncbi:hypothetical protein ACLF6K_37270 [Streptomyces xanthophaeus]|uniref:hypothetical protein n=1 Tax=Streptomyces xanthophaeus TaxID=67385 RepID=UPI00398F9D0A